MTRTELLMALDQGGDHERMGALIDGYVRANRRERVATAALQGLLATGVADPSTLAFRAVKCADALIKALDKGQP